MKGGNCRCKWVIKPYVNITVILLIIVLLKTTIRQIAIYPTRPCILCTQQGVYINVDIKSLYTVNISLYLTKHRTWWTRKFHLTSSKNNKKKVFLSNISVCGPTGHIFDKNMSVPCYPTYILPNQGFESILAPSKMSEWGLKTLTWEGALHALVYFVPTLYIIWPFGTSIIKV